MRARISWLSSATALLLTVASPGQAAQKAPGDTVPRYRLEGITVTGKGLPLDRSRTPRKVEVVSATDRERTPASDLADLLKKTASVDVIQYPGLTAGIGIRGFRPEFSGINPRTLVLIDGRPAGTANLATLDLSSVERVEVLKGPASALYGSSAMAGVVNVVPLRSTGEWRGRLSGSYGSFATTELSGGLGGNLLERVDADVTGRWFRRGDDFRIGGDNFFRQIVGSDVAVKEYANGDVEDVPEVGDGRIRPHTELEFHSGSGRVGYQLMGGLRLEARGELFGAGNVETPGDFYFGVEQDALKNVSRRTGEVSLRGEWAGFAPLLRVYRATDLSEHYNARLDDRFINYVSENGASGAQLQVGRDWRAAELLAGVDVGSASASSRRYGAPGEEIGTYSPNSRIGSLAAYAQLQISALAGRLTTSMGARVDRVRLELRETPLRPDVTAGEEQFAALSPSLGAQLELVDGLAAHATLGTAFVAPGAFNKAGLSRAVNASGVATVSVGNRELEPERSLTWDAGIELYRPASGWEADLTYFRTRVADRITSVRAAFPAGGRPRMADGVAVGSVGTYVNAAEAHIEGLEWRLGFDLGAAMALPRSLRVFANATHLLEARERVRSAIVDVDRFTGREDFAPGEVVEAFEFGESTSPPIRNVAEHTVTGGVEYDDLRRFSSRLSARYVGERVDQDFRDFSNVSDIRYPAFLVADWVMTLRLAERYQVSGIVRNLTDENYYEKRGYSLPGRQLSLRVSVEL